MEEVPRSATVALAATAAASTGAGAWLVTTSGEAPPAGFLQYVAVAVGTTALGSFVLWHRPRNRYGLTHQAVGVLFGTVVLAAGALSRAGTAPAPPDWAAHISLAWSWLAAAALLPLWVIAIAAFPDARFHRPLLKHATVALAVAMPLLALVAYLWAPAGEPPPLIRVDLPADLAGPLAPSGDPHVLHGIAAAGASALGTLAPVAAVLGLLDRFRTAGPLLRQQIKWLLLGAAVSVALQAIPVQEIDSDGLRDVAQVLVLLAVPLPLVAAGIAIFRHGLWEIDVVISKSVVYALSSVVLTALFLGVALVAGVSVGGRDSRVVAALLLALLVSFVAHPLRQRLERVVRRALFGAEPRGLMALTRLAETVTPSVDARHLGSRIADVTREALGATWAGAWLYLASDGRGTLRPVPADDAPASPSAVLPPRVSGALAGMSRGVLFSDLPPDVADPLRPLFVDRPALVASMTSGGDLIGLIACGERPQDPFREDDLQLLSVVARESALALRNVRLEEELRRRLEQIERQAAELHSSRQRLVAAQDRERRRIERDLHDGAQQQLVALAARLRRAARSDEPGLRRTLDELADEAEDAVFTLQELARGIYPSLLADRGLQSALQAHAARLPANVHVEVEPVLRGRRLDPEIEAALYFVALEAMTNAVKHAPGSRVTVSLRARADKPTVILEVHDDGPGLDVGGSTFGSGLQNMADRIDALGGTFAVESAPGAGVWIRAEVQEGAEVIELRRRAATP